MRLLFLLRHRNKLSHELAEILLNEGLEYDVFSVNLSNLFSLRIKIEKWWILYFEVEFMDIENVGQLEEKYIITGGEIIYQLFTDLLSDDKEKASYYVNELRRRTSK